MLFTNYNVSFADWQGVRHPAGCFITPALETQRLLLRGWRFRDLGAHARMSADPLVMRYIGDGHRRSRRKSHWDVAMHAGRWMILGYGQWALERREDGMFIGRAGLWPSKGWPGLELGWKLDRAFWGAGYATEAGRAAIAWAWRCLDPPLLTALIHHENIASRRVARSLGMRQIDRSTYMGRTVLVFGLGRRDKSEA